MSIINGSSMIYRLGGRLIAPSSRFFSSPRVRRVLFPYDNNNNNNDNNNENNKKYRRNKVLFGVATGIVGSAIVGSIVFGGNTLIRTSHSAAPSSSTNNNLPLDGIEKGKQLAAYAAVDDNIKNNQIIGIGSGSTVVYAVQRLSERVKNEGLTVICIPSSFQSRQLIIEYGLPLSDLTLHPSIDITIDGADDCDTALNLIKGGGGCMLQEKLLSYYSKKFIIIADYRKNSLLLGQGWKNGIPLEVHPLSYTAVSKKLIELGGIPALRMAIKKAGPVVTDNGNFIIDVDFPLLLNNNNNYNNNKIKELDAKLHNIPGIIETGLFLAPMAKKAYFGYSDGSVKTREGL